MISDFTSGGAFRCYEEKDSHRIRKKLLGEAKISISCLGVLHFNGSLLMELMDLLSIDLYKLQSSEPRRNAFLGSARCSTAGALLAAAILSLRRSPSSPMKSSCSLGIKQLANCVDPGSSRALMFLEPKKSIHVNPAFHDQLEFLACNKVKDADDG
ncbi:hypothetical protein DM860_010153 [Cuscuta australis]|uniref:Uncharacterized protein n=1 Tax=Cuscuta australis TaxID=267555 RepID=A0A328DAK0_9ASTE|nr:hypothetical protein DM860_010153 [Cuscuta australis]